MIGTVLKFLFGSAASATASKAAGGVSALTLIGAIGGGVLWLFGPGREWQVTLNALELSGVALGASMLIEYIRRVPPPGS